LIEYGSGIGIGWMHRFCGGAFAGMLAGEVVCTVGRYFGVLCTDYLWVSIVVIEIKLATNELSSIERMIQELMQKREDKMYELEDRKAEADVTQEQINDCRRTSKGRLQLMKKR
jgi:hypothetical protein